MSCLPWDTVTDFCPNSADELRIYQRYLQLAEIINTTSLSLLGLRTTGKSTLLRNELRDAIYIDLLDAELFRRVGARPESLREPVPEKACCVVIDEVQKLPSVLDEVQRIIDRNKDIRFALTGSNARKLKRGAANLLGGRALLLHLHPLMPLRLKQRGVRM
jgi:predicted AAA+ superfamily ATPase